MNGDSSVQINFTELDRCKEIIGHFFDTFWTGVQFCVGWFLAYTGEVFWLWCICRAFFQKQDDFWTICDEGVHFLASWCYLKKIMWIVLKKWVCFWHDFSCFWGATTCQRCFLLLQIKTEQCFWTLFWFLLKRKDRAVWKGCDY